MTVLCYKCCFWFSLRLGSILSALISILKAVGFLTINIVLFKEDVTKGHMRKVLLSVFNEAIVDFLTKENLIIFTMAVVFVGVYILSCIFVIIGAILCKPEYCYPFLATNLTWTLLDTINYVVLFKYLMSLTFIPAEELHTSVFGLGPVIVYLTILLLYIFFEAYLGICVYSFVQVVKILRMELMKRKFAPGIKLIFKSGQLEVTKMQKNGGYYY